MKNPKLSLSGTVCRSAYVAGGDVGVAALLCTCVTVELVSSVNFKLLRSLGIDSKDQFRQPM